MNPFGMIAVEGGGWRARRAAAAGLLIGLCAVGTALAQADTKVLAERETFMKRYGSLAKDLRGQVASPATLPQVAAAADEIAQKADSIPGLFPPGSEGGDALPAIWQKPSEFASQADTLRVRASALADAARAGDLDATRSAFGAMGQQGCGGCHEQFRRKDS